MNLQLSQISILNLVLKYSKKQIKMNNNSYNIHVCYNN
jgi:hypothetical protein